MTVHSGAKAARAAGKSAVFRAEVRAVRRITPNMLRVTFGGAGLRGFTSGGYDQRLKLLFPQPDQDEPVLPSSDAWYQAYREMPDRTRPVMRTYTAREHRPDSAELDIDFALHGDLGPASRWARRARQGDVVGLVGPDARDPSSAGVLYRPEDADWQLIVGDDTALPAISAIVRELAPHTVVRVFVEVATAADIQDLDTPADITWLSRSADAAAQLVRAVRDARLPSGRPYAWAAGESGVIRELRGHLVNERGWDRGWGYFGGYWRAGLAEGQEYARDGAA